MKLPLYIVMVVLGSALYASSGVGSSASFTIDTTPPTADLMAPAIGDVWFMNEQYNIVWTSSDANPASLPVQLSYSTDNGNSFLSIGTPMQNTGIYQWIVPPTPTNAARVRLEVSDAFGNTSVAMNSIPFQISYPYPSKPQGLTIQTPFGGAIEIGWVAVTQDVNGQAFNPDGYIVLYSESPYTDLNDCFLLGTTSETSLIHYGATDTWSSLFYRVIAYKNNNRSESMSFPLTPVSLKQYTWGELKEMSSEKLGQPQ